MSLFDNAIALEIAKIEQAIAEYYERGEDPPGFLTSQWADLKSKCAITEPISTPVGLKIRYDFLEFAYAWVVNTPSISYPQVWIAVTELKSQALESTLENVTASKSMTANQVVIDFTYAGVPQQAKGYVIAF